jgi:transposase-like protein
MSKRSNVTRTQRRDAVLSLLRREETAAQLSRRWGVSEPTLYRWRDDFLAGGEAALTHGKGKADPRVREIEELRSQVEERELVIGELTVANRVLKKLSGQCR